MAKQDALITTQISVTIPNIILEKLDTEVQATGRSRQEIIRQLLADKYMETLLVKEGC